MLEAFCFLIFSVTLATSVVQKQISLYLPETTQGVLLHLKDYVNFSAPQCIFFDDNVNIPVYVSAITCQLRAKTNTPLDYESLPFFTVNVKAFSRNRLFGKDFGIISIFSAL